MNQSRALLTEDSIDQLALEYAYKNGSCKPLTFTKLMYCLQAASLRRLKIWGGSSSPKIKKRGKTFIFRPRNEFSKFVLFLTPELQVEAIANQKLKVSAFGKESDFYPVASSCFAHEWWSRSDRYPTDPCCSDLYLNRKMYCQSEKQRKKII